MIFSLWFVTNILSSSSVTHLCLMLTSEPIILSKYSQNKGVVGEIYQNIVQNWKDEGIELRGYKSPISMRNIANDVDDKTIESLLSICRKN